MRRLGLIASDAAPDFTPLTGGVASDIWLVRAGGRVSSSSARSPNCASPPTGACRGRNASEAAWLEAAGPPAPGAARPSVLAHAPELGFFAWTICSRTTHHGMEERIAARDARTPDFAGRSARRSAPFTPRPPAARNRAALQRRRAVSRHPPRALSWNSLRPGIRALSLRSHCSRRARSETRLRSFTATSRRRTFSSARRGPVFLDAECAWYGDPAFDLAFCLNHLLLKCLWTRRAAAAFLDCFDALSRAYLARVCWEPAADTGARAASLLPALLLARIDGKSPVEYVTGRDFEGAVRRSRCPVGRGAGEVPCDDPLRPGRRRWPGWGITMGAAITSRCGRRVWDSRGTADGRSGDRPFADGAIGRAIAPAGASMGSGEAIDCAMAAPGSAALTSPRGRQRQRRNRARADRPGDAGPARHRCGADRARRHAQQVAPRRQRDRRDLDGGASCRRGRAAQPLWRYLPGDAPVRIPLPEIQILAAARMRGGASTFRIFWSSARPAATFWRGARAHGGSLSRRRRVARARGSALGRRRRRRLVARFRANEDALDFLCGDRADAGFTPGEEVSHGARCRRVRIRRRRALSARAGEARTRLATALASLLLRWVERYPLVSIEDPFAEDDIEGFQRFTAAVGEKKCRSSATTSSLPMRA